MNRLAAIIVIVVFVFGFAPAATAYPTMVRHGYASCQACHVDPGGAGQLSAYGRAQSELLVQWHPGGLAEDAAPSTATSFLFGLIALPEVINLSGNVRGGALYNTTTTGGGAGVRPVVMAADLSAAVDVDWFIANVSLGYGARNVGPAVVVSADGGGDNALVSRTHWVGVQLADKAVVIRAGRLTLPFGLRNNEHPSFVRAVTRTDINVDQQHGLAVAYNTDGWRGEVMAIAGNFQVRPDAYRERGYSAFVEWSPMATAAVGVSSLVTRADKDIDVAVPLLRQAHGVFARVSPVPWLALLGEADVVANSVDANRWGVGGVGWLQADFEPVQGVHIAPAIEASQVDATAAMPSTGAWLTLAWYPLPHTELRADAVYTSISPANLRGSGAFTALLQLHLFL